LPKKKKKKTERWAGLTPHVVARRLGTPYGRQWGDE